ncbi:MAG: hypothetical protein OXU74_09650 [Gemmatimonadota bacterium]|nr:hypothetical protein [Gemmatimonadota bacterium]
MSARAQGGGAPHGGGGEAGRKGNGGATSEAPARVPIVSMILMAIFLVGGSIGLLADWPAGPYNLDWGVWVVLYGGYGFVIGAAILHARTGR